MEGAADRISPTADEVENSPLPLIEVINPGDMDALGFGHPVDPAYREHSASVAGSNITNSHYLANARALRAYGTQDEADAHTDLIIEDATVHGKVWEVRHPHLGHLVMSADPQTVWDRLGVCNTIYLDTKPTFGDHVWP